MNPQKVAEALRALADAFAEEATPVAAAALKAAPLLTASELAELWNVSVDTLGRRRAEGMPHVFVGSSPRFDLAACTAWLERRRKAPKSPDPENVVRLSRGARPRAAR